MYFRSGVQLRAPRPQPPDPTPTPQHDPGPGKASAPPQAEAERLATLLKARRRACSAPPQTPRGMRKDGGPGTPCLVLGVSSWVAGR